MGRRMPSAATEATTNAAAWIAAPAPAAATIAAIAAASATGPSTSAADAASPAAKIAAAIAQTPHAAMCQAYVYSGAEDGFCKIVRVERPQVLDALADADEL